MPDLFIAPEEKPLEAPPASGRNRIAPVPNQPTTTPTTTSTTDVSSHQIVSQKNSFYEEGERRNGMIPLFTSFWQNPHSIYFDTQEPDEHILLFLRRHFITNGTWIAFTIILVLLPLISVFLFNIINYPLRSLPQPLTQIILFLYYLLVTTNAFVNFLDWYYNISIITTKRVLDIQLKDLVNKKVSATKISLIQDVDFKQTGTIPSLFNYGDVIMQTAGKEINFIADAVPSPEYVVQVVESLIGKEERVGEGGQNATI